MLAARQATCPGQDRAWGLGARSCLTTTSASRQFRELAGRQVGEVGKGEGKALPLPLVGIEVGWLKGVGVEEVEGKALTPGREEEAVQ